MAGMTSTSKNLETNIEACIDLLVCVNSVVWAERLHDDLRRLRNNDLSGVKRLLGGGMGSFLDLCIHPLNGNTLDDRPLTDQDTDALNHELDQLRTKILRDVKMLTDRERDEGQANA
jgi:hypothetical protein